MSDDLPSGLPKMIDPSLLTIISTGKSEVDRAAELKGRAQKLLIELCSVMDEGFRDGLLIRWNGISLSPFIGKHEIIDLHIEKRF